MRRTLGIIAMLSAPIVMATAYSNLPDANTCRIINNMNAQLGMPASCTSTPAVGYWIVAAILCIGGILMVVIPRSR